MGVGSRRPQRARVSPCVHLPSRSAQISSLRFGSSIFFSKLCCCLFLKSKRNGPPNHVAKWKGRGCFPWIRSKTTWRLSRQPLWPVSVSRSNARLKSRPGTFRGGPAGGGGGWKRPAGGLGSLSPECLPRGASWEALRSPFKGHGVASRTAASGRRGVPQRRPRPEGSLRGRGCRCRAYSSGGPGKWLSPGPACSPSPLGPENRRRRSAACHGPAAQTGADSQWSSRRPEPGWRPRALRRQRWGATPLSTAEPRLGTARGGPAHAPGLAVWERAGSLTRHAGGFSGSRPTSSAWCLTRRAR